MKPSRFTVRVYGILISKENKLLVSHEQIGSKRVTKFPGGGLEFGEGLKECLHREFLEETGFKIKIENHFYTTDFFIQNHFDPQEQVIAVYFKISFENKDQELTLRERTATHFRNLPNELKQEWISLPNLSHTDFTFKADQLVAEKLVMIRK